MTSSTTEFWDMFATSANPMLLIDDDRVYTDANPAACRLLRRSREEIVGHAVGEFSAPGQDEELADRWREFVAERRSLHAWRLADTAGRPYGIHVVAAADVPVPGRHLGVLLAADESAPGRHDARLSPREAEVTRLLAQGLSGEAIARELFLSPETVRTHIRNAMDHVGARTRAHLVAIALREALIEV